MPVGISHKRTDLPIPNRLPAMIWTDSLVHAPALAKKAPSDQLAAPPPTAWEAPNPPCTTPRTASPPAYPAGMGAVQRRFPAQVCQLPVADKSDA